MVEGQRSIDAATAAHYYQQGWWRDRTLIDDFLDQAAAHPDRVAVVSAKQASPVLHRHSYAELERLSRRFAAAFLALGVRPGDVVSVQLPNSWEFPALVYGALRAGAIVNPLVPIFRRRELTFILNRTETAVLVVIDRYRGFDHGAMGMELLGEVPSLQHVVVVGDAPAGAVSFADMFCGRVDEDDPALLAELERRRPGAEDLIEIQFTSGTTGEPKGVIHHHNTVYSGGRAVRDVYGLGAEDVCFMASTLAHQTGFGYGMLVPFALGMKVVYQDAWQPEEALDLFAAEGVTWTVGATTFAMDQIAAQQRQRRDVPRFELFICGGAAIPPHVVHQTKEYLGAQLVAVWGMTENMIVTTTRPGDPAELVADSDGTVVDWMEVRIVDEAGNEVPVDGVGDLQVRGPSQALGYFKRPDIYAAASPGDGWFDTGDLARRRADGGIRIVGRTKDLVIRGGENIPVAEIENVLFTHPAVAEVAVVAVAHERLGEQACAVIVVREHAAANPPTLGELTAFLAEAGMAKQFWPEQLRLVDSMPRTPSGKIQKFQLRQQIANPPPAAS